MDYSINYVKKIEKNKDGSLLIFITKFYMDQNVNVKMNLNDEYTIRKYTGI